MIEGGDGLRLAAEACEPIGVTGSRGGEDLQRHEAVELGVLRRVDLAHAAAADGPDDSVMKQAGADHEV